MFELESDEGDSTIDLAFANDLGSAMIPLPGRRVRWGFQIDSALSDVADGERLRKMLAERAPWRVGPVGEIDWGTVTHFERRMARPFGRKRAWLAGDAAHVTGPFGGQSMNVGLTEAHGLIRRIADSIEGKRGPEALEQYDAERQREWHKLLGCNVHFDLLPHAPRWLKPVARQLVAALPASGRDLEHLLSSLGLVVR
jgi:2-polyprenyl-6-methoxyphenol hydroxylase-like FAD-dependent oxidoreductase